MTEEVVHETNHWPAIKGYYIKPASRGVHQPLDAPDLQTVDEREKRIDKDYQRYMKVQKRLLEENPTDYDTPAKLKRNMPLTRDNFVNMNGSKARWGGGMSEEAKSFIQNDLPVFANEIYEEVIQTNWFLNKYGVQSGLISPRSRLKVVKPRYRGRGNNNRIKQHDNKQHSFYNPRIPSAPYNNGHFVNNRSRRWDYESIEKLQSIFDASLDKLEHMSPEDKSNIDSLAWSKVGYRDYEGEYLEERNEREHATLKETIGEGHKE